MKWLIVAMFLMLTSIVSVNAALSDGLVVYYDFETNNSVNVSDMSGNGYNGAFTNVTFSTTNGKFGRGSTYDGLTSVVTTNHIFNATDQISIAFWMYSNNLTDNKGLVAKRTNGQPVSWQVIYRTSRSIQFHTWNTTNAEDILYADSAIIANRWYHITVTKNGNNKSMYINGILVSSNLSGGSNINASTSPLTIGNYFSTANTFNGSIDNVRIYNRSLSAAEVATLASNDGLILHYDFEENTSTLVKDKSGAGTDGVLINTTLSTTNGKVGKGAYFRANTSYINSQIAVIPNSTFSILFWLNKAGGYLGSNQFRGIISQNYNIISERNANIFSMYYNAANHDMGFALPLNSWDHFAVVHNGTHITTYVNGVKNGSVAETNILTDLGRAFEIGRYYQGSTYFNGSLDDVRVYDRALTAAQIALIGNFSYPTFTYDVFPSGNILTPSFRINGSVVDEDHIYSSVRFLLYDSQLGIVSQHDNTSLTPSTLFNVSRGGTYYFRTLLYNTLNDSYVDSGLSSFTYNADYGSGTCSATEHKVWQVLPLIALAGVLIYVLLAIEMGTFGTVGFLIALAIDLNFLAVLINTILTSC